MVPMIRMIMVPGVRMVMVLVTVVRMAKARATREIMVPVEMVIIRFATFLVIPTNVKLKVQERRERLG